MKAALGKHRVAMEAFTSSQPRNLSCVECYGYEGDTLSDNGHVGAGLIVNLVDNLISILVTLVGEEGMWFGSISSGLISNCFLEWSSLLVIHVETCF